MAKKAASPTSPPGPERFDVYRAMGDAAGCRSLATAFYALVARDPVLRPLFPGKTMTCAIEEFTAFLVQFFGGPSEHSYRRWWLSLRESHQRFPIGPRERAAWMNNMVAALSHVQMQEPVRAVLRDFFEASSAYVVNSGRAPAEVAIAAERPDDAIHREIARRWDAQRDLDDTVAAVRSGDAERAIALTRNITNRSILVGLLGVMIRTRHEPLLRYVKRLIATDREMAHERYAGRTLLHEASAQGSLPLVKLLLGIGADPDAADGGGHTPLYSVANECTSSGGGSVVRALAEHRANVNAAGGVKRCTPLHMAARRGNLEVAEALLECGADIEARDSLGETPLRRAVNCNKSQVAALLLQRGADVHSRGSRGLTPVSAARTSGMKQILENSGR